jgi:hypothetical protein|mmetsp:Transcript_23552/g.40704  ORF Transcript_23552/g.40704 Transcript_23552/m.40704 type:complete len:250 (-) Transcript_23552:596-1345(-)
MCFIDSFLLRRCFQLVLICQLNRLLCHATSSSFGKLGHTSCAKGCHFSMPQTHKAKKMADIIIHSTQHPAGSKGTVLQLAVQQVGGLDEVNTPKGLFRGDIPLLSFSQAALSLSLSQPWKRYNRHRTFRMYLLVPTAPCVRIWTQEKLGGQRSRRDAGDGLQYVSYFVLPARTVAFARCPTRAPCTLPLCAWAPVPQCSSARYTCALAAESACTALLCHGELAGAAGCMCCILAAYGWFSRCLEQRKSD